MEYIKCTDEHKVIIDKWLERTGFGLVIKSGENEFPVSCNFSKCVDEEAYMFVGDADYKIFVYESNNSKVTEEAAELYKSDGDMIATFALFRAGRE